MAKMWFNYTNASSTCAAQITPSNYTATGSYPPIAFCALANRTCLIYSFYSSGSPIRPADVPGGPPAISANIQSYIFSFCSGGGPVVPQPTC